MNPKNINIFAYKPFLSFNISDFIFYVKIATPTPPKKSHPPLKVEVLSSQVPPFLKIWLGAQLTPPPSAERRGAHYAAAHIQTAMQNMILTFVGGWVFKLHVFTWQFGN